MSEFKCEVVQVTIEPHPNGEFIELARIGDYLSVVKKGEFQSGDLAVYIPEQAMLPAWLLSKMGFVDAFSGKGKLHGAGGNRVKAAKLRGIVSQGLMLKCESDTHGYLVKNETDTIPVGFGDDLAEFLGITKYEPLVPSHMRGNIIGVDFHATHGYDFDNLKKTPDLFEDGEEVVITEKIHGTLLAICVVPEKDANEKYYRGRVTISSKGMGAKGFVLDHNDEGNIYAQTVKKYGLLDSMFEKFGEISNQSNKPVFLMGEVFGVTLGGKGVQDMTYAGVPLDFRAFDICLGNRENANYFYWSSFKDACNTMKIETVPLLYKGSYFKEMVLNLTDGQTTIGKGIREGVVVKSFNEAYHPLYGRKIAKSVSNAYLLRKTKDATEYN